LDTPKRSLVPRHTLCVVPQAAEIGLALKKDFCSYAKHLRLLEILQGEPLVRISFNSKDLRRLIRSAGTLRIDQFPPNSNITALAHRVASEQVSRSIAHISIFFSAAGGATPLHYDANDVLVIQGRGLKTILVAQNPLDANAATDKLLNEFDAVGPLDSYQIRTGQAILIRKGFAHTTVTERLSLTMGVSFYEP
jgi:ribosomal protein L16 Arg81 hydroxylase